MRRPVCDAVVAAVFAATLAVTGAACSSGDSTVDVAASTSTSASTDGTETTEGTAAEDTTTTTAYVVPPIEESTKAELCAATKAISDAGDELSALLVPALAQEDSPQADMALIDLLPKTTVYIDKAKVGYDRLAAVLPAPLNDDAIKVRDTTVKIYTDIAAVKSITELQDVIEARREDDRLARESSARLEATVKQTCNLSLYGT